MKIAMALIVIAAALIYSLDAQSCSMLTCAEKNTINGECDKGNVGKDCDGTTGKCVFDDVSKKNYCYRKVKKPGDRCIKVIQPCGNDTICQGPPKNIAIGEDARCQCRLTKFNNDSDMVYLREEEKCANVSDYKKKYFSKDGVFNESLRCSDANRLVQIRIGFAFVPLTVVVVYWFFTSGY